MTASTREVLDAIHRLRISEPDSELFATLRPWALTDAEVAAGVTPVNYAYAPGDVKRYGATGDGVTNDAPAFQQAIDVARHIGCDVIVPQGNNNYLLTDELDCTISTADASTLTNVQGFTIRGTGNCVIDTSGGPGKSTITAKHTGHVFDCTGSFGINFENLAIGTDATTYPKTCFFFARVSNDAGSIHHLNNVRVRGKFSEAVVYNYGAEDDVYQECVFFNTEGGANAKVYVFTANNIRSLTSSFVTVATGNRSTIGHFIIGGSIANVSHHADADGIYLENIRLFKMIGPHLICADGTGGGRSHIYVNTTNGGSDNMSLYAVSGEVSSPDCPAYGIYVGDTAVTTGNWEIIGCTLPHATAMIKTHANVTLANQVWINVTDESVGGGGVDVDGTLQGCYPINISGGIAAGTLGDNNVDVLNRIIARAGDTYLELRDTSAAANRKRFRIRSVADQFVLSIADDSGSVYANFMLAVVDGSAVTDLTLAATNIKLSGQCGFQGANAIAKPTVTGSRGGNAALASLLTALANYGLITDSSS